MADTMEAKEQGTASVLLARQCKQLKKWPIFRPEEIVADVKTDCDEKQIAQTCELNRAGKEL